MERNLLRDFDYQSFVRKYFVPIILFLILIPSVYTGSHTLLAADNPEGVIKHPSS